MNDDKYNNDDEYKVYVIVVDYNTATCRFWSGKKWVSEYPDAEYYSTFDKACAEQRKIFHRGKYPDCLSAIIKDYGLASEKEVP